MEGMNPIFKVLCHPLLLQRCLKGKTQNPNEFLNNIIWSYVLRQTSVGIDSLEFRVGEAMFLYNNGCITKIKLLKHLGLTGGKNLVLAIK